MTDNLSAEKVQSIPNSVCGAKHNLLRPQFEAQCVFPRSEIALGLRNLFSCLETTSVWSPKPTLWSAIDLNQHHSDDTTIASPPNLRIRMGLSDVSEHFRLPSNSVDKRWLMCADGTTGSQKRLGGLNAVHTRFELREVAVMLRESSFAS